MKPSTKIYLGLACLFTAEQALACCQDGCFSVSGQFHLNSGCTGGYKQINANYGSNSECVFIGNTASVTLNNNGCGSSAADIHFFKTDQCEGGPGAGFAKARGHSGLCVAKPEGAAYAIVVSGNPSSALCAHPYNHPDGVITCGYY